MRQTDGTEKYNPKTSASNSEGRKVSKQEGNRFSLFFSSAHATACSLVIISRCLYSAFSCIKFPPYDTRFFC